MHLKRRLNYTGRKRINKSEVQIYLMKEGSGPASFTVALDLSRLGLPDNAPVIIEARQRDMIQRFHCGTVGSFQLPGNTALTEVDAESPLSFWVRVIDPAREDGRLLAVARSIHPAGDVPEGEGRDTLLALKSKVLGELPWTIEFPTDEDGIPWLVINSRIPAAMDKLQSDPVFQGLIFPAAVREILGQIFLSNEGWPEGSWQLKWLQHGERLADEKWPERDDDVDPSDWIGLASLRFCEQFKMTERAILHARETNQ